MKTFLRLALTLAACWAIAQVVTASYQATENTAKAMHKSKSFQELALVCAMDPQASVCSDPSLATAAGGKEE